MKKQNKTTTTHEWATLLHWARRMRLFILIPTHLRSPAAQKYSPEHQMWIDPPLKIVPNKYSPVWAMFAKLCQAVSGLFGHFYKN